MICLDTRLYKKYRSLIGRSRMYVIINALMTSSMLDEVNIYTADTHDKIFKPRNDYEKIFWESSRGLTKQMAIKLHNQIQGGKKGGRPKKIIDQQAEKNI